jgi:hypothetical protein
VWALRVGYGALATTFVGLGLSLAGNTSWVLAVGMIVWLLCAVILATEFLRARNEIVGPRPSFWSMRIVLLHDTVHALGPTTHN